MYSITLRLRFSVLIEIFENIISWIISLLSKRITSPVFFFVFGILITICFVFIPFVYDPLIVKALPIVSIDEDQELIDYLASIQDQENIIIGVHGYTHKSPISGKTICEYYCTGEDITYEMVKERVDKGIDIFNKAGLIPSSVVPPGMSYDDKFLKITEELGYVREPYYFEGPYGFAHLEGVIKPEVQDKIVKFKNNEEELHLREYTWEWRNVPSTDEYMEAKKELDEDVEKFYIDGIVLHIQDYNEWTELFLESSLQLHDKLWFLRVDDVASKDDLPKLKRLVKLANDNNRFLLIAVIPAHISNLGNTGMSNMIKSTWVVFVSFFMFPIAIMLPLHWYERRKIRKTKRIIPGSPKVSMILPAYNEEKFIYKSIEQSLNQDYKGEIEVVVIDDGSTDKTYEIAKEFAKKNPNVKVYKHLKNSGKPAALNTGFHKATGDICLFSDTDSHLDVDLVSKMIPHFDDPKVGLVAAMIVIDNEVNLLTKLQQIEYLYNQEIVRFCQATHKGVIICPGAGTAVRTQIARDIPSTERTITEDADFTLEVLKAGWKVTQEPEAVSRTDAPEDWRTLLDQRKRWLYGVLQAIWIHKWALFNNDKKTPNPWIWWAWIGYITCPITTLAVLAMPFFVWFLGTGYLIFLIFYSLIVGAVFIYAHWYGLKQYFHEDKIKLAFLLPIYMVYQYLLNVLLFYLVIVFVLRIGVKVRYGGRIIHAV